MAQHNEIELEKEIAKYLAAHGWQYSPNDDGYGRERALFPEDVLGWLADTQPEQLEKAVKPGFGDVAKQQAQLLDRMVKVLDTPLDNGGGTPLRTPYRRPKAPSGWQRPHSPIGRGSGLKIL